MDTVRTSEKASAKPDPITMDGGRVLDELGLPAGATVLDVGTGKGNWAVYLAERGYDVLTGEPETDGSHYARQDWRQKARDAGVLDRIRFEHFDASRMPFADGSFEAVFFFGVLHHIDEAQRRAVFAEALRVAKPGGAVVFFEPTQAMLERIRVDDAGHPEAADPSAYMSGEIAASRTPGAMMDAHIYRETQERRCL